jgi:hypothetical protein
MHIGTTEITQMEINSAVPAGERPNKTPIESKSELSAQLKGEKLMLDPRRIQGHC